MAAAATDWSVWNWVGGAPGTCRGTDRPGDSSPTICTHSSVPALESWKPPQIQMWGPYNGGLGAKPPAGSRVRASGQVDMGAKPPKAETLLIFGHSLKVANLPTLKNWKHKKIIYNLCCQWRSQRGRGPRPPILQTKHKQTFKLHEIGQFGQFKIIQIVATRSHFLKLKCTKFDFGWGCAPHPAGEAHSPLAGF